MVNVIKHSKNKHQALFRIHANNNTKKSINNYVFEEWIHKDRTVRQLINIVSVYFGLNVHSFYLTLKSHITDHKSEIKDQLILIVDDDRLLSDHGIVFSQASQYNFIICENDQHEENDQAQCFVCLPKEFKYYPLTVDKNTTASQLYEKALQLCKNDDYSTDTFVLTFNFFRNASAPELVKLKITEDDTRLLSEIGVVYRQGIKNHFEVSLSSVLSNENNNITTISLAQNQKTESQSSKMCSSVQNPVLSVSRKQYHRFGYRGLVNQALTCYLNSFLQVLYMTPEFRNAMYDWKLDRSTNFNEINTIPFQLQKLFLNLQTSPLKSVETKELTHSFGWHANEIFQQNDIQEFCRAMLESLDKEFKNHPTHVNLINQLFQGTLIDRVKCLDCGVVKSKEVSFLDIPLSIRPFDSTTAYASIEEALKGFTQPETLEGDNQYHCDRCNKKCDAHKDLKFSKFPYILTLYLKRFAYDKTMKYTKLHDKVTFPLILYLNSFVSNIEETRENEKTLIDNCIEELIKSDGICGDSSFVQKSCSTGSDEINQNEEDSMDQHKNEDECAVLLNKEVGPYVYELYAIVIHSGNVSEGHYYAYIKDLKTDQWLCFNDQSVSEITMDDIEKSFGGSSTDDYSNENTRSSNAYMLMYRQIDIRRNKNAKTIEEFPSHLKDLHDSLKKKFEEVKRLKEKGSLKVNVYSTDMQKRILFTCNANSTVIYIKTLALKHFEVTEPCRLVVFNKSIQKVVENLEFQHNRLLRTLNYKFPYVLRLLPEDSEICQLTSENILMKIFVINLDENEEDADVSQSIDIEVDKNRLIGDLSSLIRSKYKVSYESRLHYAIHSSSEPLTILEPTVECSSVYSNSIFVFIQNNAMSRQYIVQKMTNIFQRYDSAINTIQLKFVLLTKNTGSVVESEIFKLIMRYEVSQYRAVACNLNNENKPMSSLEDLNQDSSKDNNTLTTDCNLEINPEEIVVAIGNEDGKLCEGNLTDNERIINDAVQDNLTDSSVDVHDQTKISNDDRLDKNNRDDTKSNNELKSNEKYMFNILNYNSIWSNASKNDIDKFYANVDKRMSVNDLKNYLVPHINIQSDFIILHHCTSENKYEELDFPSRSLEDLNHCETIYISVGVALHDGEYRGTIFLLEYSEQTQIVMNEMFDWIIKVGTSVLETKKELVAKLHEIQNIDIPLERCRLRKKKQSALFQCYFNDDVWSGDIGQGWEMLILDLKDRSELVFDKTTKRLMFVNHVENNDSQDCKISEMEFVVEIASTTPISIQLIREISTNFNLSEDQIELGYAHNFETDIIWKASQSQWPLGISDYDNTVLFFRFV